MAIPSGSLIHLMACQRKMYGGLWKTRGEEYGYAASQMNWDTFIMISTMALPSGKTGAVFIPTHYIVSAMV
ncbi:hypothetical protein [Flavipsychrobacter stenotrophus]|uniref:hypothetical protein n=1 Tax=Flavipsychrobacter stenotrophus TaxID=2077091 RepID=UPI001374AD9E|nr:hypothetical protein [Flavipsychrobacter stenotrophus]